VRRAKRKRRARHVRARLEAEARRLAADVDRVHFAVHVFAREHLDRYERDALDRARGALHEAGEALESLESSLRQPAAEQR
jgi:hypothetical protein